MEHIRIGMKRWWVNKHSAHLILNCTLLNCTILNVTYAALTWRCLDSKLKVMTAARRLRSCAYVHVAVQSERADMIASSTCDTSWRWRQIKKKRRNKITWIHSNKWYSVIINSLTHLIRRKSWWKLNRTVADFGPEFLSSFKWDSKVCCARCEQVIGCRWE